MTNLREAVRLAAKRLNRLENIPQGHAERFRAKADMAEMMARIEPPALDFGVLQEPPLAKDIRRLVEIAETMRTSQATTEGRQAPAEPPTGPTSATQTASMLFKGASWQVRFAEREVHLPALRGVRHLAELVAQPNKNISVFDLDLPDKDCPSVSSPPKAADLASIRSCRSRLENIALLSKEAQDRGDVEEVESLAAESRRIENYLETENRQIRTDKSGGRRVKDRVTSSMRHALRTIARLHPELDSHLKESLVTPTGNTPSYRPKQSIRWIVALTEC